MWIKRPSGTEYDFRVKNVQDQYSMVSLHSQFCVCKPVVNTHIVITEEIIRY